LTIVFITATVKEARAWEIKAVDESDLSAPPASKRKRTPTKPFSPTPSSDSEESRTAKEGAEPKRKKINNSNKMNSRTRSTEILENLSPPRRFNGLITDSTDEGIKILNINKSR